MRIVRRQSILFSINTYVTHPTTPNPLAAASSRGLLYDLFMREAEIEKLQTCHIDVLEVGPF